VKTPNLDIFTPMSEEDRGQIERYEFLRAKWIGRCRYLLWGQHGTAERLAILLADEVLNSLEEDLAGLEARLPAWYEPDDEQLRDLPLSWRSGPNY
jgi:hypothetical protein